MPKPSEFAVHLMIEGGHREKVSFPSIKDFQAWYGQEFLPKQASNEFISVPIKNVQGEYMVVRPAKILAIRVEPVYTSSVDRDYAE